MHTEQRRFHYLGVMQMALPWLVVVVLVWVGYLCVLPPRPLPHTVAEDRFSAARAIEHVRSIATEPHPMGTPANAAVRTYIVAELQALGIDFELQTTNAPYYYGGGELVPVVNVIARIPGAANSGAVAIMSHYDTVPASPGANDSTAAVAAMLETGRALLAGPPLRNDVVLLFTDAEEPAPRYGATAFVDSHPAFPGIAFIVNLEASGGSGASLLVETSGSEAWLVEELAAGDSHLAAFSFLTELARLLGDIGTDFDAFRGAGVPGLHFAYLHGGPIYHTEADNVDAVNWGSLQHHGTHALSVAQHFGGLDLSDPPPDRGEVFFTIRPLFVHYPIGWAIPLALLIVGVCSIGIVRRTGQVRDRPGAGLVRTAAALTGVGLTATFIGTVAWLVIVALRPTPGVGEGYLYLAGIMLVTALAAARVLASIAPKPTVGIATVLVWVALAVVTAFALPGFSYLFAWPALAAAIALLWMTGDSDLRKTSGFFVVVAPTVVLSVPAIDIFFQLAQPRPGNPDSSVPAVAAIPILLALLSIGLVRAVWPEPRVQYRRLRQDSPH